MPQPVYRAKHRVGGRLRAASGGCSCTDAARRRHAPTPMAWFSDAEAWFADITGRGYGTAPPHRGCRTSAHPHPHIRIRASVSAHPYPTTNALQQATYTRLRNGYLVHPIAAGALGDRTRRTYWMDEIGHAGRQTDRTDRQSRQTDEHTDGQASNQIDRRSGRTNKQPKRIERTDCKYAAQRTTRILTVPLGIVSDCKYANGSLPRVLTVGIQTNPPRT